MAKSKRQQAIRKRNIFLCLCAVILAAVILVVAFAVNALFKADKKPDGTESGKDGQSSMQSSADEQKPASATILSTGDIIVHDAQLAGAKTADGGYDFSAFFKETAAYFKSADLAVANLEVNFGGTESGKYAGYPSFNTPDSLADAIKASGLNLLITSNNHRYDTGLFGFKRTLEVLKQKNIESTGTKLTADEPSYLVKNVNGINIGIANFTYETDGAIAGRKYLNGIIMAEEANSLINSFSYKKLDEFYTNAQGMIDGMKSQGAEYIVFYMHWGNEYQLSADTYQKTVAQKLSNLGVDMIVGSHPHVIQPAALITPEGRDGTTICLYSTGNFVSNQRQELMDSCPSGHTEDGVLWSFTLKKNKDGVTLDSLKAIPTWVNKYKGGSGYLYTVYPLENPNDAESKYKLDSAAAAKAKASYERTKQILSSSLAECQRAVGCEITFN